MRATGNIYAGAPIVGSIKTYELSSVNVYMYDVKELLCDVKSMCDV